MSFGQYCRVGWHLCGIAPGGKLPDYKGWNTLPKAITDAEIADELSGAGLLHAYSGTCAIDIDDFEGSRAWLAARDVDLDALWNDPEAVRISSGRKNRGKLLYALPLPLTGKKIIIEKRSIIDFRCGTSLGTSQQDVLPGTIHPDTGKPYVWQYPQPLVGSWRTPPVLPASLHGIWLSLLSPQAAPAAPVAPQGVELEFIRRLLAEYDPDMDRDSWIRVLAAVHHETRGADYGLALVDEWSKRSKKYNEPDGIGGRSGYANVAYRWSTFRVDRPGAATLVSLTSEQVAKPEEFPIVTDAEVAEAKAADVTSAEEQAPTNKRKKLMAQGRTTLEKSLVFVAGQDAYFDVDRRIMLASDHAIRHVYTSRMPMGKVNGKTRPMDPIELLMTSDTKRVVDSPGFHPGEGLIYQEGPTRYINEYQPNDVIALKPTARERECIEWIFARLEDDTFRKWLIQFLGHIVQKPGIKIHSAPLIWSETTGNGKTTLMSDIPALLVGRRYSQSVENDALASQFNDYLIGKWHIYLKELHIGTRAERTTIAKKVGGWITDTLAIHPKGKTAYTTSNHIFITATSNESNAAVLSDQDRRWGVTEMTAPTLTDNEKRDFYEGFLRTPRAAAVLRHYFLNVDISDFRPAARAPETQARSDMIESTIEPDEEQIRTALEEQRGPFVRDVVSASEVQDWLRNTTRYAPTQHKIGRLLRKSGGVQLRPVVPGQSKLRLWCVRNTYRWRCASGAELIAYWKGETDELPIDPLLM